MRIQPIYAHKQGTFLQNQGTFLPFSKTGRGDLSPQTFLSQSIGHFVVILLIMLDLNLNIFVLKQKLKI